ncbi:MAG: dihydropteroate synthase, partial [Steroidobacter sp.]
MIVDCGPQQLNLTTPVVMGVLNVTPDSFSDGGKYLDAQRAIDHAHEMISQGARIIDIGGESTRPGAALVSAEEESRRTIPVIEAIAKISGVLVSIDTSKPEVMRQAVAAGACIINDVRALQEPDALTAAAATRAGVCLMHMKGEPRTMQDAPSYDDVVGEVRTFLRERVKACFTAGIELPRLVADPGFGFGKRVVDNLVLLKQLDELEDLGVPLAVGLSRKSMLARITGRTVDDR